MRCEHYGVALSTQWLQAGIFYQHHFCDRFAGRLPFRTAVILLPAEFYHLRPLTADAEANVEARNQMATLISENIVRL